MKKIIEEIALSKYPEKYLFCYPSESNHNMGGTCDINYYERQAYIEGIKDVFNNPALFYMLMHHIIDTIPLDKERLILF